MDNLLAVVFNRKNVGLLSQNHGLYTVPFGFNIAFQCAGFTAFG